MPKQVANTSIVVLLFFAAVCTAQRHASLGMAVITGRVVTLDGQPAGNVQVDLRDELTGASVQSGYTNPAGQFEIDDVAPGRYLVVATSCLDEASENIQVSRIAVRDVILRLPRSFAGGSSGAATESSRHWRKCKLSWPGTESRRGAVFRQFL